MIRSRAQVDEIAAVGMQTAEAFRRRSPAMRELLEGAQFRAADTVFDTEHRLDLGDLNVRLIAMGANHTAGDTVIVVEQDRVVFSGDLAMKPLPAFASPSSSLARWLTSLDRLDALAPRVVVPSHGPTGDAGFIAGYRRYLTRIRDRTTELKRAGKSLDEAMQTIVAELKSEYPDTGRVGGAVRAAYAEAT
jgi:glyoxylase-like metal-dependent hydrolase (beta-lactamase superfamily II)